MKNVQLSSAQQEATDLTKAKSSLEESRQGVREQSGRFCSCQPRTEKVEIRMDKQVDSNPHPQEEELIGLGDGLEVMGSEEKRKKSGVWPKPLGRQGDLY